MSRSPEDSLLDWVKDHANPPSGGKPAYTISHLAHPLMKYRLLEVENPHLEEQAIRLDGYLMENLPVKPNRHKYRLNGQS